MLVTWYYCDGVIVEICVLILFTDGVDLVRHFVVKKFHFCVCVFTLVFFSAVHALMFLVRRPLGLLACKEVLL